jgi:hypothetical protein
MGREAEVEDEGGYFGRREGECKGRKRGGVGTSEVSRGAGEVPIFIQCQDGWTIGTTPWPRETT